MAARKKTTKKKATRSKPAAKKKTASRTGAARPAKKSAAPRKPATPSIEAVARKIVRVTRDLSKADPADLYAADCTSCEPGGEPQVGLAGLEEKGKAWNAMQDSSQTTWTAKNVFIKRNTICIEWEAQVKMRDGRTVAFEEVAIHEVKAGKIIAERYYYDPASLAPPGAAAREDSAARLREAAEKFAAEEPTGPPVDPMDL